MKIYCHTNCRFKSRAAPFCGFCMIKILGKKDEKEGKADPQIRKGGEADGQENEAEGAGKAY